MVVQRSESENARLNDAARAGWLYYIAGNTQDEIAAKLNVSRQTVQRLVALASSEQLVKVRIDHPIAHCMELAHAVRERYGLRFCEVTPSDPASISSTLGIANAAAALLERRLVRPEPAIVAIGTGEEMRAMASQLRPLTCAQHRLVALVGTIAPDGSASLLDAVSVAAEIVKAPHFPMPCSVIAQSKAERDTLYAQRPIRQIVDLARAAELTFVGIGSMAEDAPLVRDGFLTLSEMRAMMAIGAAGEITGWAYDDQGRLIEGLTNERVVGAPPVPDSPQSVIGVSMSPDRLRAIKGALAGRLINGLITNDRMAERLLK
jgi:DNA-binding transcriptional regulator LsrR (DeoR family)